MSRGRASTSLLRLSVALSVFGFVVSRAYPFAADRLGNVALDYFTSTFIVASDLGFVLGLGVLVTHLNTAKDGQAWPSRFLGLRGRYSFALAVLLPILTYVWSTG